MNNINQRAQAGDRALIYQIGQIINGLHFSPKIWMAIVTTILAILYGLLWTAAKQDYRSHADRCLTALSALASAAVGTHNAEMEIASGRSYRGQGVPNQWIALGRSDEEHRIQCQGVAEELYSSFCMRTVQTFSDLARDSYLLSQGEAAGLNRIDFLPSRHVYDWAQGCASTLNGARHHNPKFYSSPRVIWNYLT